MGAFQSAIWDFLGRIVNYLVTFAVSVVLTRLLMPEEFGAFGIIVAITVFAWVVLDFGFRSAVVQTEAVSQTQLSTVFFANLAIGVGLMIILIIAGPVVESFYEIPNLALYFIGISPVFLMNGLLVVPSALVQRDLKLKQMSIFTVVGAVLSGAISVALAFRGFGVWSLVVSNVASTLTTLVACYAISRWRPTLEFDLASIKSLFSFGWRIFLSSLLDVAFSRADVFVIGKLFDITSLGFYTRALSLDQQVRMFSVSTIVTVMLPMFSRHQNDLARLKHIYYRALNFVSFAAFAASGLLVVTATDLFLVLFTEKWISSAGYFQIMSISSAAYPLSYVMLNLISGRGNSKALLRLEIFKKILLVPAYLTFIVGGIYTFLIVIGSVYVVSLLVNMVFVEKELGEPVTRQLSVILTYAAMALLSAAAAYLVTVNVGSNSYIRLIVSTAVFSIVYLGINWIRGTAGLREVSDRVSAMLTRRSEAASETL